MGDYTKPRGGSRRRTVGVRELKAHAAGILRHVRETQASYLLTHRGKAVGVILPLESKEEMVPDPDDAAAAWEAFTDAGQRLQRRFKPGVDGVRILSDMRR